MIEIMKTQLSKEVDKKIKEASRFFGIQEKDLIKQALTHYLDSISPYLSLKREFTAWDKLSDESFYDFEKSL